VNGGDRQSAAGVKPTGMDFFEGQTASATRAVTSDDVEAFARLSGDNNPVHLDAAYAQTTRFGKRIAHGMLTVSYVSAVLGTALPGPGSIYLSQNVSFLKPVFLDDSITATVTVTKFRAENGILTLSTECWNQDGVKVVDGQAVCLVPVDPAVPARPATQAAGGVA